jgi:hypothetical protein
MGSVVRTGLGDLKRQTEFPQSHQFQPQSVEQGAQLGLLAEVVSANHQHGWVKLGSVDRNPLRIA